jgi:hypothetical protein
VSSGSCSDGVKNGSETDVDCGGTCGACPIDSACAQSSDCKNAKCVMGLCTACPLDTNLLFNGDAESAAPGAVAPGWQFVGGFSVQSYDSGNLASTDPGPTMRGKNYFAGGVAGLSSGTATLDLSACSKLASVQPLKLKASAYLGGFGAQDDNLTVQLIPHGAVASPLSVLGPVSAADRNNLSGLLLKQATVTLPPGTCCVDVRMSATKRSGYSNDGYADNLTAMVSLN